METYDPARPGVRPSEGLAALEAQLDGELYTPDTPGYDAVRRPTNPAYADSRPQLVVRCASEADVVRGIEHARRTGAPVVARAGGHCFAGRSSTTGIVLDLAPMNGVTVTDDGLATIGPGAQLGRVYAALHVHGRTLPAGCGDTVGITGLTLGGGIGLLGRSFGLTCDRLVGARVVLADGRALTCGPDLEPDLFWALRGAGGGQFGVVTALVFDTVPEPTTTCFEVRWPASAVQDVIAAWQRWAPDAPDEVTANLTVVAEPGEAVRATLFGLSQLAERPTRASLAELCRIAGPASDTHVRGDVAYSSAKGSFSDLDPREGPESAMQIRSEFFDRPMRDSTAATLVSLLDEERAERRQLTFVAMAGAYSRVPSTATAFAHRSARFSLEHTAVAPSPWVSRSWTVAHADGSGGVYANFPDPDLPDWALAYHGENYRRLAAVKARYDPAGILAFPQCVEPAAG